MGAGALDRLGGDKGASGTSAPSRYRVTNSSRHFPNLLAVSDPRFSRTTCALLAKLR